MRKAIFIFIAIILVAASIDWIRSCNGLKSHKEVPKQIPFKRKKAACASSMATSGSP